MDVYSAFVRKADPDPHRSTNIAVKMAVSQLARLSYDERRGVLSAHVNEVCLTNYNMSFCWA
jgi:hypothetical protein